jgi:hypothetical protein
MGIDWGKVLTSKTLWVNVVILIIGVVDYIIANASGFPFIPWQVLGLATVVFNLILRFLTNDSLIK